MAVPGRRRNDGRDHFRVAKAGEFLAAFELTARGFDVSIAAEGLPYDLVAQIADRLLRVQVKTAMQPVWDERYVFHTQLGSWPATDFFEFGPILEGNQFIFANINGVWHGGAADWYRPGQACKGVDDNIGRDSFSVGPLSNWVPRPGEVFGIAATTPSRLYPGFKTLDHRSDVALIVW